MRIRRNPNSHKVLLEHDDIVIMKPEQHKGKWNEHFGNNNPINVELGMGRGTFITTHAFNDPDKNFIGIDLISEVVRNALDKILQSDKKVSNIALIPMNIELINDVFELDEISTIYLNFSDPWPKAKHAKRRLTHRNFLNRYKLFLKDGGQIIFKTDSKELFDFSVPEFEECGFLITDITYDLHSLNDEKNIMTEYEEKFSSQGKHICRLKAVYNKK